MKNLIDIAVCLINTGLSETLNKHKTVLVSTEKVLAEVLISQHWHVHAKHKLL